MVLRGLMGRATSYEPTLIRWSESTGVAELPTGRSSRFGPKPYDLKEFLGPNRQRANANARGVERGIRHRRLYAGGNAAPADVGSDAQ